MTPDDETLAFYTQPGVMTSAGRLTDRLHGLPSDIAGLARIGQGTMVHEHMAGAYGVALTDDDRRTVHLRPAEQILEAILAKDDRPLTEKRPPVDRIAANCRHFTVLMVTLLRAQGIPARARCGFGAYFSNGTFEDHWVAEYWNADEARWILVDAQIDRGQLAAFPIDFDVTDVPRDRFLIAGDAWARCQAGDADPDKFGLTVVNETGRWWIAANLVRDAAALNNFESLPWDIWGAMPSPTDTIDDDLASWFDDLTELTQSPDEHFDDLQHVCTTDLRQQVPPTVFNALLGRDEAI